MHQRHVLLGSLVYNAYKLGHFKVPGLFYNCIEKRISAGTACYQIDDKGRKGTPCALEGEALNLRLTLPSWREGASLG